MLSVSSHLQLSPILVSLAVSAPTLTGTPRHSKADLLKDQAQLLTVPPNAFAFFVIIGNAWHSDRKKERPLVRLLPHLIPPQI